MVTTVVTNDARDLVLEALGEAVEWAGEDLMAQVIETAKSWDGADRLPAGGYSIPIRLACATTAIIERLSPRVREGDRPGIQTFLMLARKAVQEGIDSRLGGTTPTRVAFIDSRLEAAIKEGAA